MTVSAGQSDFRSPLDETLNTQYRYAVNERACVLYHFGRGDKYIDAASAPIDASATYANQGAGTTKPALANIYIQVPQGALKVYVNIKAGCQRTNADCHYQVTVDGQTVVFGSLPGVASAAWQTAQAITLASAGWKAVSVDSHNEAANPYNFALVEMIIYAAE